MLIYHIILSLNTDIDNNIELLKEICLGISDRYEINFLEIGLNKDKIHFLVQSISDLSIEKIVLIIMKIISQQLKIKKLWKEEYIAETVHSDNIDSAILKYIQSDYIQLYKGEIREFSGIF